MHVKLAIYVATTVTPIIAQTLDIILLINAQIFLYYHHIVKSHKS